MNLITRESDPRCRKALTLKRPTPCTAYEKSASPSSSNSSTNFSGMIPFSSFSVSTGRKTS